VNPAYVTVEMWNPGGEEKRLNAESMFLIELTEDEIREKYNERAGKIVQDIQQFCYMIKSVIMKCAIVGCQVIRGS